MHGVGPGADLGAVAVALLWVGHSFERSVTPAQFIGRPAKRLRDVPQAGQQRRADCSLLARRKIGARSEVEDHRWPGFVQMPRTCGEEGLALPDGEDSTLAGAGMSQPVMIDQPRPSGRRLGSTCGARPGSLEAASSMPGRPKRSKVERTRTFESSPRGPAGDTLTEKPREPTRRIEQLARPQTRAVAGYAWSAR